MRIKLDERAVYQKLRIPPGKESLARRVAIGIVLLVSGFFMWSFLATPSGAGSGHLIRGGSTAVPGKTGYKYTYAPSNWDKPKATFVTLVRNRDLAELIPTIRMYENTFNRKFKYDWVFLNDEPFTDEFRDSVTPIVSGNVKFGLIPKSHWSYPDFIDKEKAANARAEMVKNRVIYGGSESYRHMCRFESGFFYRHPLMDEYDYYWRVEPGTKMHCNADYDIFRFMRDNGKKYGFTISIHEYEATIKTLWQTTRDFMKKFPQFLHPNNMLDFISDDEGASYNLCHFWSNFEVGDLNLWRGEAYTAYFDYLDKAGGFFYERWGDAPVHSIAAALFLDRDEIHHFGDLGYFHVPFNACPIDDTIRMQNKCGCDPKDDFTWQGYSCTNKYYNVNKLKKPHGWQEHA